MLVDRNGPSSIANVAKELAAPDGGPVEKRNEDRDEKDLG
jgi:hypothetical protein